MTTIKNNFLNEYFCGYTEEHKFLHNRGFRYNFVKEIDGITVWKYPKSIELYKALEEFYLKNN